MKLKMLIVEDRVGEALGFQAILMNIPSEVQLTYGITAIEIQLAHSLNSALAQLRNATESGEPFDIGLIDLGLPMNDGDLDESPDNGQVVLNTGIESGALGVAIIITVESMHEHVVRSFRYGAIDYILKVCEPDDLQRRVLAVWERWTRQRCKEVLLERVKELACHAERGLGSRLGAVFSECMREVFRECENLEIEISQRQGLDPTRDANDPLFARLGRIREVTRFHLQTWEKEVEPWSPQRDKRATLLLASLFGEVRNRIEPCLINKRVRVNWPTEMTAQIYSFGSDVRLVLDEMFLGALNEIPDELETPTREFFVQISHTLEDGRIVVALEDSLTLLSCDSMDRINHGWNASEAEKFGRSWGLSVVQRVALCGGGRLEAQIRKGGGNRVIFHIPVAPDE